MFNAIQLRSQFYFAESVLVFAEETACRRDKESGCDIQNGHKIIGSLTCKGYDNPWKCKHLFPMEYLSVFAEGTIFSRYMETGVIH